MLFACVAVHLWAGVSSVISVVHLLIVASEAVAYTELLRSPNRPQPSLARPPRVWLEIALCGVVFVAVGIKAYEHEHNLVFLVKMLAWVRTLMHLAGGACKCC